MNKFSSFLSRSLPLIWSFHFAILAPFALGEVDLDDDPLSGLFLDEVGDLTYRPLRTSASQPDLLYFARSFQAINDSDLRIHDYRNYGKHTFHLELNLYELTMKSCEHFDSGLDT